MKNWENIKDLEIEIAAVTAPIIVEALGMVNKGCKRHREKIPGESNLQLEIQVIGLTSTAQIRRKALSL